MIRVLLADDHATVRRGLQLLLAAQSDIDLVGEATDGREAVAEALRLRPDVVVMDIAMPEMNGVEATARIRDACPATGVLILSMHASVEHIGHAMQAGALGYLLKECAGPEVADAIRCVHGGARYLSPKIDASEIDEYSSRHAR